MITHVNRAGTVVSDMERSIEFYTKNFGMALKRKAEVSGNSAVSTQTGYPDVSLKVAYLAVGTFEFSLLEFVHPRGKQKVERNDPGVLHLSFHSDNVEEDYRRLKENGVRFVSPPQKTATTTTACWGLDPDGAVCDVTSNRHVTRPKTVVSDLERSIEFYTKNLGMVLTRRAEVSNNPSVSAEMGYADASLKVAYFALGTFELSLLEFVHPRGKQKLERNDPGVLRLSFHSDNVENDYCRLRANGARFVSPPQKMGAVTACWGLDPDGVVFAVE